MKGNAQILEKDMIICEHRSFRTSISKSWDRCIQKGLTNLDKPRAPEVPSKAFNYLLEEYKGILDLASPYMKSLFRTITKKGGIVGLSSNGGVLLHIEGNVSELEELGYQKGYIHLESYMGTNAIGTCIETGKPIIVWGEDHFFERLRGWVGFAAPVYISEDSLGAVLFVMIPVDKASRTIMAPVSIISDCIGRQLRLMDDKEKLLDMQKLMQEVQNKIIETSSIISHEVRNSLTNISAYIQLLQLEKTINKQRGDKILKEIARVNRLLDDFRLLSRHRRENIHVHSLNEIMQFVIDVMVPKAELNKVEILYSPCQDNINISTDRNALHQVFINLIDNAIQAMEGKGGSLRIDINRDLGSQMAIISFQDTGPGIPSNQLDQIFKIFHTTKNDGSGIGLYISQAIIRLHGGSIEVESVQGEGATFIVKLPIGPN